MDEGLRLSSVAEVRQGEPPERAPSRSARREGGGSGGRQSPGMGWSEAGRGVGRGRKPKRGEGRASAPAPTLGPPVPVRKKPHYTVAAKVEVLRDFAKSSLSLRVMDRPKKATFGSPKQVHPETGHSGPPAVRPNRSTSGPAKQVHFQLG